MINTQQGPVEPEEAAAGTGYEARDLAFGEIWSIVQIAKRVMVQWRRRSKGPNGPNDHSLSFDDIRSWMMYAAEHPGRGRGKGWRKPTVNVTELVDAWIPIIRGMATAHDKATVDQCEFEMDTHLMPLLSAPVKQIREFYTLLVERLKTDPTIPLFVWVMFESWGDVILKHAPDGEVRALKKELATQIANLVEGDVRPDIGKAIAGALQWRSPEQLEKIHAAVRGGAQARIVGRESCLFLQVDDPTTRLPITVML